MEASSIIYIAPYDCATVSFAELASANVVGYTASNLPNGFSAAAPTFVNTGAEALNIKDIVALNADGETEGGGVFQLQTKAPSGGTDEQFMYLFEDDVGEDLGDGWYNEKHARVNFVGENNLKVMEEVLGLYKKVAKSYVMTNPGTVTDKGITAMAWVNACQSAYDDYGTLSDELNYSLLGRRVDSVAEKGNLVLLPLPAVNGVNMSYANTDFIRGFGISKYINEDKIENAMKLIEFSQTVEGNKALHDYYGGIPSNDALWAEDYWKTGCFSGSNADNVLKGIENDGRDDYADILKGDAAVYEKNVRLRAIAAGYIMQDFRKSTKRIDAFEEFFSSIGRFFNSTIIGYGVPYGYNPAILEKGV